MESLEIPYLRYIHHYFLICFGLEYRHFLTLYAIITAIKWDYDSPNVQGCKYFIFSRFRETQLFFFVHVYCNGHIVLYALFQL